MLIALTVDEAAELIRTRTGFTVDPETGCWLYGDWFYDEDRGFGPYLAFYEAAYGEVPDGCRPYHTCTNGRRGCVRPSHLDLALPGDPLPEPTPDLTMRNGFAHRLKDERKARRWEVSEMAKFLGVSANTLRAWERGETVPTDSFNEVGRKFGWGREPRKWAVIVVAERIVESPSAGGAIREVLDQLELESQPGKTEIAQVKPA